VGFYIRKSFGLGPVRLNLSRSGLGASLGVRGARIGIGPRGRYIHLGRGGLYYRKSLGTPERHSAPTHPAIQARVSDHLQEIVSAPAAAMSDSSSAELLTELNRVEKRWDRCPITVIAGVVLLTLLVLSEASWWAWTLALALIVSTALYARHIDVLRGTAILHYDLEDGPGKCFGQFQNAFHQLGQCHGVWHIDAKGHTDDWKRNAGVQTLANRSTIRPISALPSKVQCNIKVPMMQAARTTLYFFPDRLLVYNRGGVGAVAYEQLHVHARQIRFVENDSAPRDAAQVDTTWRYVNKKGGPDRRFNNNRQLPIMLYGELHLTSPNGLNELFQMSVPGAAMAVVSALEKLKTGGPISSTARA
jgi:Protein of unknown function (DUF4236)